MKITEIFSHTYTLLALGVLHMLRWLVVWFCFVVLFVCWSIFLCLVIGCDTKHTSKIVISYLNQVLLVGLPFGLLSIARADEGFSEPRLTSASDSPDATVS
jgi:hypothetical protein